MKVVNNYRKDYAPFRVYTPTTEAPFLNIRDRQREALPAEQLQQESEGDQFLTRLVKLIPAEIIAIYLAGYEMSKEFIGEWSFICLVLVLISRIWGTREAGKVQWLGVVVSAISFVVWIYAMGNYLFDWVILEKYSNFPSLAVLVWTFLVPFFYKGD